MVSLTEICLTLATITILFKNSVALECYQCSGSDSDNPFQCNEWLNNDIDLKPQSCDAVHGAQYCIKHTGRYQGNAINCYQCSAANTIDCSDGMIHMGGIEPQSCDHVFEAQYCIKSTSLEGGVGASRFCSSVHLGNYCNYVKHDGDKLTYRTCIFTCSGDGCNPASTFKPKIVTIFASTVLSFLLIFLRR